MFPFGENPLEPTFKKPSFHIFDQIQNPILLKNDDPPFFPDFPSPFFHENQLPLNQIFPTFTPNPVPKKDAPNPKPKPKQKPKSDAAPLRRRSLAAVSAAPTKRTGKKDRHSKICTAQGIRDRRMRLSLQVARNFFDLQDLLGYDKASKTIEWLFNKSKKAIKELAKDVAAVRGGEGGGKDNRVSLSDGRSESFISEDYEVMSGIEENCSNNEIKEGSTAVEDGNFEKKPKAKKTDGKSNSKESREKARARARCRTEEKMMGKRVEDPSPNLEQLGGSSSTAAAADYAPPPSDVGTIEKLLGNSCDPNTNFMGFLGNWDFLSNDRINYAVAGNPNLIFPATAPDFPLFHQ